VHAASRHQLGILGNRFANLAGHSAAARSSATRSASSHQATMDSKHPLMSPGRKPLGIG